MPTTTRKTHSAKEKNRILSVTIRHHVDDSPDTSHLGEYSQRAENNFAIDRAIHDFVTDTDKLDRVDESLRELYDEYVDSDSTTGIGDLWTSALCDALQTVREIKEDTKNRNWSPREYRYFNPSFNYVDKDGNIIQNAGGGDTLTPEEVRKYVREDYERMESLNRGNWSYIGITAEAKIGIPSGQTSQGVCYTTQRITSGGLWGIESDSERSYIESEEKNQLADLREQLLALGFSKRAISKAFEEVKHAD
jgi:hypothetical protein